MAIAIDGGSTNFVSTISASPSANRTVTVPDATFTVAAKDVAQTFTAAQTFGADVTLNAQSDLRFADADSSNWVAFQAPATVSSNVTWTLPAADGTSNQALVTNGTGTLSWATASASPGGSTTQLQYNNAGAFGGISGVTSDGTRITASTTIGVGGATPSTSGSGISFPATASASSDANTLDDYEEGTWTPAITGSSTAGTATYTNQVGTYTKIGNRVFIQITVVYTGGTGSGNFRITGLPFTTSSTSNFYSALSIYCSNIALTAGNVIQAQTVDGATRIDFGQYPTGGGADSVVPYDAAGTLVISGHYQV